MDRRSVGNSSRVDQSGQTDQASDAGAACFSTDDAANDINMSVLSRTIEQHVIPRLMLASRSSGREGMPDADQSISVEEVSAFAMQILSDDEASGSSTIEALRERGVSIPTIYIDLLAPAARHLGALWEDDRCTFADVTVGLGRLQRLLRELGWSGADAAGSSQSALRVLLLPAPGEQHTLGLVMVAEFFRRAGWQVSSGSWAGASEAISVVTSQWVDAIGFSISAEVNLPQLTDMIHAVRRLSCNPQITILVGGPVFGTHTENVSIAGADAVSIDGSQAPQLAERLIRAKTGRCHTSG